MPAGFSSSASMTNRIGYIRIRSHKTTTKTKVIPVKIGDIHMLQTIKKNLWNIVLAFWALIVALFWFAMRVIWSGISKVLSEAAGEKAPSTLMLNIPLFISIFLWIVLAFAVTNLIWIRKKKWPKITLAALLGVFTIASAAVVIMGAVDYLYFIIPKFFLSLLVSICIAVFALLIFFRKIERKTLIKFFQFFLI